MVFSFKYQNTEEDFFFTSYFTIFDFPVNKTKAISSLEKTFDPIKI